MQNSIVVRRLVRLSLRMESNARQIREATLPSHLTKYRKRALRHVSEANHIRDFWADHFEHTRKPKYEPLPPPCPCHSQMFWRNKARYGR